ncbi:hypothetical protein N7509_001589 [Penicillium cosmopolitanum]|uniref:Uncharacterized protein n=1 Tax=Penicillium cosmopolitanum TaxID=1131564 RepID=A0A9W9W783_9EURO|nr:uncharacterized protein N7509_001589 [Penicillium cosmopolitanum]KAJ5407706.1 hypothetical protein N7509_001589 [Penicillium cosmopolitanum]
MNPSSNPSKPPKLASPAPAPAPASPTSPTSPTSSVSSGRLSKIPLPQLKQRIQLAINARTDGYATASAIIVYWEDDDTGAEADAKILESTFKNLLGIEADMWKIPDTELMPTLSLHSKIVNMMMDDHPAENPLQTLFIFAYIGHGDIISVGGKSEHVFKSLKPGRHIFWSRVRDFMDDTYTSILAILDCCKSGLGGVTNPLAPAVQVLAACLASEQARGRGIPRATTFTQRLAGQLDWADKFKETFINTETLFQRLQLTRSQDSPTPVLQQNGGLKPILLNFKKKPAPRSPSPSRIPRPKLPKPDAQHVLVKLTLTGPEAENIEDFENFIKRLPAPFHVRVVDAFKSSSSLVIMRMRWETWARLSTVLDLEPIGAINGDSLLRGTASASAPEVRQVGENLPLRPGPSRGKD